MKLKKSPYKVGKLLVLMIALTAPLSAANALVLRGPLIIDDAYVTQYGSTITDTFQGTLTEPAITVTTTKPIVIINSRVSGPGDLIFAKGGNNITVKNTIGFATNPNQLNVKKGMFVRAENPKNVVVENCSSYDARYGVYVSNYSGNRTSGETIKIANNIIYNTDGRPSNGAGGYVPSGSFGNSSAIQLRNVTAVPSMEIAFNQMVNHPYQSQNNTIVEIISSSGTATSHFLIHDNFMKGAYPGQPGVDAYSGGGLLINGSANDTETTVSGFIDIYANKMINSSNHGMAIAAGHDINMYNNRVISSGFLADCVRSTRIDAVGMYNWNLYNKPATIFFNNHIHDNVIGWVALNKAGVLARNDWWLPGQNNQAENNKNWTPIDAQHPTIEDENLEYKSWLTTLHSAHQLVGARSAFNINPPSLVP